MDQAQSEFHLAFNACIPDHMNDYFIQKIAKAKTIWLYD